MVSAELDPPGTTHISLLSAAVAALDGRGAPAHRIWLPPLTTPITLGQLLPDLATISGLGLTSQRWREEGPIPLGVVDRPRDQRHEVLTVDFTESGGGHLVVVGAPRSGKSTLLATFVLALGLLRTPRQVRCFVIDPTGTLGELAGLPHVAGLAGPHDHEVGRRIVAEVRRVIAAREAGAPEDDEVYVVIDGWDRLVATAPALSDTLHDIGSRGLAVNVHLVASTTRWGDLRLATRELFNSRLELRQGDPLDSHVDRRIAATVPSHLPGRGLTSGSHHFLAALPRLDPAVPCQPDLSHVVRRVAEAWTGPPVTPLQLLPRDLPITQLPHSSEPRLGLRERDLSVLTLPTASPHLLIFGDSRSGKSNLLRTLGQEICRVRDPGQAQLVVIDPRRSLLGDFDDEHLLHSSTTADQAQRHIADVAAHLTARLPGNDVTPKQLRARSWWTGPEVYVMVDDYDLVVGSVSPLTPLLPLLAQAGDVGLHLFLARRAGGAARALFEPTIQTLRDLGAAGLLLSASPEEGPLIGGVRGEPAPPGRGHFVSRETTEICQIAWSEPAV